MRFNIALLMLLHLPTACTQRIELLRAEYVSMVTYKPPSRLDVGRKIAIDWCTNEDFLDPGIGDGEVGLIDQVVLKANRRYKTPYILKPHLVLERTGIFTSDCVKLVGFLPKGV